MSWKTEAKEKNLLSRTLCTSACALGATVLSLFILSSCSLLSERRTLADGAEDTDPAKLQTVPKADYDQLLKKYQTLLRSKISGGEASQSTEDLTETSNPAELRPKDDLVETVDVFSQKNQARVGKAPPAMNLDFASADKIEEEIIKYRKGVTLFTQNNIESALIIFKELESSKVLAVRASAKFMLGEILFKQGEYDLAMQIYEEIIQRYAGSGVALDALGRLVVCSEKLKLTVKKEQYYSLLHEFFGEE